MRALLDVNVLIAYFDSDHTFHDRVFDWFTSNVSNGWASSPLTENGTLRILSNSGYSNVRTFPLAQLVEKFHETTELTDHHFWADDVSLLDKSVFDPGRSLGSRHLTDLYLLALAVKNQGRLVTLDSRISISAVLSATEDNLCVI